MRLDDCPVTGGSARVDPDRAEAARLVALALARKSADAPDGRARVAEGLTTLGADFTTLMRCVRRDPPLLAVFFTVEARALALLASARPEHRLLARHAQNLVTGRPAPIATQTDDERLRVRLYELSLIAGAAAPPSISAAARELSLRTPEARAALAFLLLRSGRVSPHRLPIEDMAGWPERLRRVFFWRYLAFAFHRRLATFADPARTFRLALGAHEKARVARLLMPGQFAAARRAGLDLLRPTLLRSGLPPTCWFDLSLTLPKLARLTSAEAWVGLVRATLGGCLADDYLARPATVGPMTRRFGGDGLLHLYRHYGVRSLFEQSLETGARSAKRILRDFSRRYPLILPPQTLDAVEAFTADRDTFITIINDHLLGRASAAGGGIAEIVSAAFETPVAGARAIVGGETGRRMLAALAQFKAKHDVNLLRSVAFDAQSPAAPAGLEAYLTELRNAFALELAAHAARNGGRLVGKPARRRLFESFMALEFGATRMPADRIGEATDRLRVRALGRINAALAAQAVGRRLESADLEALAASWLDAEPVVTLLARLSDPARPGGPSADAALLVLHAAKAAAAHGFMAFKFDDASGRRQLAFLSEAQRTSWRAARALARVGGAERPGRRPRLKDLMERLEADLAALRAVAPLERVEAPAALRAEMNELAGEEIKDDPAAVAARTIAAHVADDCVASCARACLADVAARLGGAILGGFEQRNAARLLRALVRIGFADRLDGDACQAVLAGVRAIEREIPKDMLDGETISNGLVVTAFDCSPRLMLTIGDVVNTGSCLNYQSGARIAALPAYVVDANIQALVSWRLKQDHFESVRDYRTVLNAFVAGRPATAAFDGDRLAFRFSFPDGARRTEIETSALGFAHLRQIVRLGWVRQGAGARPGLLAERAYAQPHPLQPLMQANHADILRTLSRELGAVDSRPIEFPPSRNPDGVYCDALGGVQPGAYAVP